MVCLEQRISDDQGVLGSGRDQGAQERPMRGCAVLSHSWALSLPPEALGLFYNYFTTGSEEQATLVYVVDMRVHIRVARCGSPSPAMVDGRAGDQGQVFGSDFLYSFNTS